MNINSVAKRIEEEQRELEQMQRFAALMPEGWDCDLLVVNPDHFTIVHKISTFKEAIAWFKHYDVLGMVTDSEIRSGSWFVSFDSTEAPLNETGCKTVEPIAPFTIVLNNGFGYNETEFHFWIQVSGVLAMVRCAFKYGVRPNEVYLSVDRTRYGRVLRVTLQTPGLSQRPNVTRFRSGNNKNVGEYVLHFPYGFTVDEILKEE